MVYSSQIEAAIAAGAAAIVAWEELPNIIDPTQYYDYTWNSDGGAVIGALASFAYCSVSCYNPISGSVLFCFQEGGTCGTMAYPACFLRMFAEPFALVC